MDLKKARQKESSKYIARTTTPVKVLVDSVTSDELGALVGQTNKQRQEQSASAKVRRQMSASARHMSSEELSRQNTPLKSSKKVFEAASFILLTICSTHTHIRI